MHLLDAINSIWTSVGDALNDNDLTHFLAAAGLPAEAGFTFLSYSDGCVILAVPKQNPDDWCSETGAIAVAKEKIAGDIAKKYGLLLCEPIDGPPTFQPQSVRRHLALANSRQTVVVVHPLFLKITLLGRSLEHVYGKEPQFPLRLGPDLLKDISLLYAGKPESHGDAINQAQAVPAS